MDIILLKDMDKLGDKHSVVSVKPGYGRNYLIPQGVGVVANAVNRKKLDTLIAEEEARESARLEEYRSLAQQMEGKTLKIGVKAGTTGKIFGSVTSVQIARAIKDQKGYEIDRRRIQIIDEVKELGTFKAKIDFGNGNETEVEFEVVAE